MFSIRSIALLAAALAPFSFAISSKAVTTTIWANSVTVAVEDNFGSISTGKGTWTALLAHDGLFLTKDFEFTTSRPKHGATRGNTFTIKPNGLDGKGHGSTSTYKIVWSVEKSLKPGLGNYWDWTLTPITTLTPRCSGGVDCGNILSQLTLQLPGGFVRETAPSGLYKYTEEEAVASNRVQGDETAVPGPLPILGAAAAFGFSRKLRKRLKDSE